LAAALTLTPLGAGLQAQDSQGPTQGLTLSLGYDGRLVFKVLDVEVVERATAAGFNADAQLTSAGLLALVKHIHQRAATRGRIVGGEPRPGVFETQKLDGKTRRHIRTVWDGEDVAMTASPPFDNLGDPPATAQQTRTAVDPLTVVARITLGGSRQTTCARSYMIFDGKQLYALDFSPPVDTAPTADVERLGLVAPFSCDVRFREVAGFSKKPPGKRDQGLKRPIRIDFARAGPDGPLVISALHAQTPLGTASIELKRLELGGARPVAAAASGGALVVGQESRPNIWYRTKPESVDDH
jgi:hypothetical protein